MAVDGCPSRTNVSFPTAMICPIFSSLISRAQALVTAPYQDSYLRQDGGATAHAVALAAPTSASTMERKMTKPSLEPRADSTARSGCGIRPATLRSRLQMPAILRTAPLGLPALLSEPSGVV